MNQQPPRLARKFFQLVSGSANIDDLLGDLDEWFYINLKTKSAFKAKLHYWKQVISLSFSYAVRKRKRDVSIGVYASSSISPDMLRNYIKVAIRSLYQYKYFSILNAFGLAIGMSVSLLFISVYSYVSTYDDFQIHKDNTYAIYSRQHDGVAEDDFAIAPAILADKIEEEFPGAQEVLRIIRGSNDVVKTQKQDIPIGSLYVEPEFLSVFSFDLLKGNTSSLAQPNQVILTESAVKKFFNEDDVVGKTLELADGHSLMVAGVLKDLPKNTHFKFEMLVSYTTIPRPSRSVENQWTDFPEEYIFVLLREGTDRRELQAYLDGVAQKTYAHFPQKVQFGLLSLKEITMGPDLRLSLGMKWDATSFVIFGIFAALVLLPACFNYTNISIARAIKRAKEIGLRKTMGGVNRQIFFQFITETIVITLVSLLGALLIFFFIRSEFQSMMVGASKLDLTLTWRMVGMFILFALTTGFVAGIFPALHFSGLNPIEALKSKVNGRGSPMGVRKGLTVFQFALSFGFILCLIVFNKQYQYSLNFDFGFQKENIVDVELQDVDREQFRTAFSQLASVGRISMSSHLLGVDASRTWVATGGSDSIEVSQSFIDANYISNFGLTFLAGKNFPSESFEGERYIIVNEEFLKAYNIKNPGDAVGQTYSVEGQELEVIGVLKNFHFAPLRYPIDELIFRNKPSEFVFANLSVTATNAFWMFSQMENTWKQLPTQKKFVGQYFEHELKEAYSGYKSLLKIVGFLGLLAMTISLLGMLGMVVYTSETRRKEVGIRKVMGATIPSIALMLSRDYIKMMGWALVFAIPATVLLLDKMLPGLQYYSATISVWDVLFSVLILLTIGILTITSQTYKTALTNPADTLRSE